MLLRRVVRANAPQVVETVIWGALSYHRPRTGGRVAACVCQIVVRRGQVRLDFVRGSWLPDPCGLLRADGGRKYKRFVPIRTLVAAQRPELAELVRTAAELDLRQGP